MKRFPLLILIFLFLLNFTGSVFARQNGSTLLLVPDGAVAVLRVNWTSARNDEVLKSVVNGSEFVKLAAQFGLEENKVSEWVVFSDVNPTSSSGLGIILRGAFTSQSLVKNAEAKNWNRDTLGGQIVYFNPADNSYLYPIRNGLLAAGTKDGIEKVQSVLRNPRRSLAGKQPFSALFAQLGNAAPVGFALGIPREYQKIADIAFKIVTELMSFTGFGLLGTIFDKIGLTQSTGFSISKGKASFPVHLIATMPDAARAKIGAGALNLMKSLPKWMSGAQTPESEVLQSLTAVSRGKMLSVKLNMPKNILVKT